MTDSRGLESRRRIRATWAAYCYLSLWAYILYGLGNATPYLREELHLTAFEAGLHGSAMAVGVLAAGITADAIARRLGSNRLLDLAILLLVAAMVTVAAAPGLPVSLAGAFLAGLGGGSLGTAINVRLARSGIESESRKLMSRANAIAMLTAGAAPLAIGLAASVAHAWRLALLLPIVGLAALTLIRPRDDEKRTPARVPRESLPLRYWILWLFLIMGAAIEFSFVFWGSTMVAARTGIPTAEATVLISLFVAGMFVGRATVGGGVGAGRTAGAILVASIGISMLGAGLVWVATNPVLSGVGLFLGGLGTAGMWPIGMAMAMQVAPKAVMEASARATLGSGFAVLLAPSALGLASDGVGVVAAWPMILGMGVAALAVILLASKTD